MTFLYHLLGYPLGWVMKIVYTLVKDYGSAIIIFTLLMKLLVFPFTWKQQISSERSKAIQPKLQKLRKAYKDNPQKMQQEQMKLYQQEHLSMSAGCLPAIIQMLLFCGVFDVVYRPLTHILRFSSETVTKMRSIASDLTNEAGKHIVTFAGKNDMRQELKIMDAVGHDPSKFSSDLVEKIQNFSSDLFGVADLTVIPTLSPSSWTTETIILATIPFLAGLFQLISSVYSLWYQKKSNPDMPSMGFMKIIMYLMPIISVIFAFQTPAGVGVYWAISALFSFLIQIALHRYLTPSRVAVLIEKDKAKTANKKPGIFQKAMEEQQRQMALLAEANDTSKLSRKELNELNIKKIDEARKRSAEKYDDEIIEKKHQDDDLSDEDIQRIEATKKRMSEKYGGTD